MKNFCYLAPLFKIMLLVLFLPCCKSTTSMAEQENLAPIPAQAHFHTGLIHEMESRWEAALEHFDKAVNLDPQSARIHLHIGICLFHLRRYGRSVEYMKRAEKYAQTDDYVLWFDIGQVYEWVGMYKAARQCYQKSVEIFPEFQKGLHAVAALENFS